VLGLMLSVDRIAELDREGPSALSDEETWLEQIEADLSARAAELARREDAAVRALEARRQQLAQLQRAGARDLAPALVDGLQGRVGDSDQVTRARAQCLAARRAAIRAREAAAKIEERETERREEALARLEEALVGVDRALQRSREELLSQATSEARRARLPCPSAVASPIERLLRTFGCSAAGADGALPSESLRWRASSG